jgi:MFS family permease
VKKLTELKEYAESGAFQSPKEENVKKLTDNIRKWKSNIRKSYLIHFFMGCHFISGVLLPFFLTWGKLTFVEVMILQSFFTIFVVIFEIPCGAIADYLSRKLSLVLGALSTALAALIYSSYPNIIVFMIGETLFALGGSLISGTDQAFTYDTLRKLGKEQEITKTMARNRTYMLVGVGISGPIGSYIGLMLSLQLTMSLMFFPFIVATIISITLREPNYDLVKEKHESYLKIVKSGVKELAKNRVLRRLALSQVITETLAFLLIWTYQLYLESLNFRMEYFGFVAASMTIVQIIFVNLIPRLKKLSRNKKLFLQIYSIIPGIAYIAMSFINIIPLGIALILIVIGMGFSRRIIFTEGINKQIETENRATVLSAIGMIACIMRSLLYPLIGYIVMVDLRISFIFLGALIIIFSVSSRIQKESL